MRLRAESSKAGAAGPQPRHLLAGFARCAECGEPIGAHSAKHGSESTTAAARRFVERQPSSSSARPSTEPTSLSCAVRLTTFGTMYTEAGHDRYIGRFRQLVACFVSRFTETFQGFTGRFRLAR